MNTLFSYKFWSSHLHYSTALFSAINSNSWMPWNCLNLISQLHMTLKFLLIPSIKEKFTTVLYKYNQGLVALYMASFTNSSYIEFFIDFWRFNATGEYKVANNFPSQTVCSPIQKLHDNFLNRHTIPQKTGW